jgi:hypothetical protein
VKRTPLRRYARLESRHPMRKRARKPRRVSTPEDRAYMDFIRTLACCAPMPHLCRGCIDPHHAGIKPGLGLKAPDDTCIPMCRRSHREWEDHAGQFRGWTREQRREWQDYQIVVYQAMWSARNRAIIAEP